MANIDPTQDYRGFVRLATGRDVRGVTNDNRDRISVEIEFPLYYVPFIQDQTYSREERARIDAVGRNRQNVREYKVEVIYDSNGVPLIHYEENGIRRIPDTPDERNLILICLQAILRAMDDSRRFRMLDEQKKRQVIEFVREEIRDFAQPVNRTTGVYSLNASKGVYGYM